MKCTLDVQFRYIQHGFRDIISNNTKLFYCVYFGVAVWRCFVLETIELLEWLFITRGHEGQKHVCNVLIILL